MHLCVAVSACVCVCGEGGRGWGWGSCTSVTQCSMFPLVHIFIRSIEAGDRADGRREVTAVVSVFMNIVGDTKKH